MGLFKSLELELNSLIDLLKPPKQKKLISEKYNMCVTENMIAESNRLSVKNSVRENNTSSRVFLPQVQDSIKYFNNLSADKKMKILECADEKLQNKLLEFMNYNAKFTDNTELTNSLLRDIISCANMIAQRKSYTEKELAVMLKEFQRYTAKANIEAERLINAFISYKNGYTDENIKISSDNKDQYAISKGTSFKQSVNAVKETIYLKLRVLQSTATEDKDKAMDEILSILTNLQVELDDFQGTAIEIMNAFIPEVINEENKFYSDTKHYAEIGIETDLCIENKIIENVLIDTLLEFANATVADAA